LKVLIYDLENTPNVSYTWGKYEQDVIAFKQEWYMLSWSAKWLGGQQITKGLIDYPNFKKDKRDDKALVTDLWKFFNEADVLIAHNGDRFDQKKSNARFIKHGLTPPSPYKTIDTLKIARRYFSFNSNKLDDLGEYLDVGRKVKTGGFDLWLGCMDGDEESWRLMKKYNKQDVLLLERIYQKLKPWIQNHPTDNFEDCPNCGSKNLIKQGIKLTRTGKKQQLRCLDCGAWKTIKYVSP
jgi:DNA polymerase elongation subunit (family B)